MKTVAVDAMGGDHAPEAIVAGAVDAARELDVPVVLVGPRELVSRELARHATDGLQVRVHPASEWITMDDHPVEAIRKKRDNSTRRGLELVKSCEAGAFVSAGNSGAVMAGAMLVLGNLPGIDRPAIALSMPTTKAPVILIDAGANVECSPLHLVHFAVMGEAFCRVVNENPSPRVGILSNGQEPTKGTDTTRAADQVLRQTGLRYIGYIEGRDLAVGNVDVAVTDGFTGNVTLKTTEGMARFMEFHLKALFTASWRSKVGYLFLKKEVDRLRKTLDYEAIGGAPLLGVNGIAVIAHGSSGRWAIRNAVRVAAEAAGRNVNAQIVEGLRRLPESADLAPTARRPRRIWEQIKGRFRAVREGRGAEEKVEEQADGPVESPPKPRD